MLAIRAAIAPFNKNQIQGFIDAVQNQSAELSKTPQGQNYIQQAQKLQAVYAMKAQLDQCFGKDTTTSEVGNRILKAALLKETKIDCSPKSLLKGLDAFAKEFDQVVNGQKNALTAKSVATRLFKDTALSAAKVEARFQYLIKDKMNEPDLKKVLCRQKSCTDEFAKQLDQAAQSEIESLKKQNFKPKTAQEISQELQSQVQSMYAALYNPLAGYHMSSQSAELASQFNQLVANNGSVIGILQKPRLAEKMIQVPKPGPAIERAAKSTEMLSEVPFDFYNRQKEISDSPVAQLLANEQQWNETLGVHSNPTVIEGPLKLSLGLEPPARPEIGSSRMPIADRISYVNADNILASRSRQLSAVKSKLSGVFQKLNATRLTNDDAFDLVKDLMIANPRSAAQLMADQPQVIPMYCKALSEISKEETQKKFLGWSLVGVTIGTIPFTFASGAVGSTAGVVLAGLSAVDMTTALVGGMQMQELSDLQRTACFSNSGDSDTCNDYIRSMNKAVGSYAGAGLSALGLAPFVKAIGRGAGGSVSRLGQNASNLQSLFTQLESQAGKRFLTELGEDSGEVLAQLAIANPQKAKQFLQEVSELSPEQTKKLSLQLREELKSAGTCRF